MEGFSVQVFVRLEQFRNLPDSSLLNFQKQLKSVLASVPFIYLALAVLFAATNSQFLICRYDPFVGIFRLDAPYTMIIFGACFFLPEYL